MRRFVLASTSRYRRTLIERLELSDVVEVTAAAPEFDERAAEDALGDIEPGEVATALARGKAESLRARYPDAWILGADQIPVLPADGQRAPERLHKPGTEARAIAQLMTLAGRAHEMVTAVALLDARTGAVTTAVDRQVLVMRRYTEAEAAAYIRRHKPLDCCGSYRLEDAGIKLFERLEGGDYTGIIGLPLLSVARLLRDAGILPRDAPEGVR